MRPKTTRVQRGVLDSRSFDELVSEQQPFARRAPKIDLTGVTFVSPAAIVQTVSACHALARDGRRPELVVPDTAVRSYLYRAGLMAAIDGVADVRPQLRLVGDSYQALRGSNPLLIEVTRLDAARLSELLSRIVFVLKEKLKYLQRDAYSAAVAISEVTQNSLDHGGGAPSFLAMQVYGRGAAQFLQIGVADCGVGLRASLASNPEYASLPSDAQAIRAAVELGTSAYQDPTHGTGLYHLLQIAQENKGSVQIRSGQAKAIYRWDRGKAWIFQVAQVPGAQIELSLGRRARRR